MTEKELLKKISAKFGDKKVELAKRRYMAYMIDRFLEKVMGEIEKILEEVADDIE